ncbi:DUF4153 domain-containing protein [Paenibacillus turpanensis]|uniref:DUF4153 domain-containing protein n=1 Tax=Paenibacillus turpanensis TaxID=2689078 RepID=UPI00140C0374|nr:DUF4173 domain-containing protein [Paenibacillus turpanensis]
MSSESNSHSVPYSRYDLTLLAVTAGFGIGFDVLFVQQGLGISVPLFAAALYIMSIRVLRLERKEWLRDASDIVLLACITLLCLTYALTDQPLFQVLNVVALPLLITAHLQRAAGGVVLLWHDWRRGFKALGGVAGPKTIVRMAIPFRMAGAMFSPRFRKERSRQLLLVLLGLIISYPLLIVVLTLLSSADRLFGSLLEVLPEFLGQLNIQTWLPHLIWIVLVAIYLFGYMSRLIEARKQSVLNDWAGGPASPSTYVSIGLDPIISGTVLTVVNLVYVLFAVIQIISAFGGLRGMLPEDTTYAEYAREGFFELLAVSIINYVLFLGMHLVCQRKDSKLPRGIKILLGILTLCTLVIVVSAYIRLSLYEEAYGFSYLRILVHAFLIYLAVMFGLAIYKLWKSKFNLVGWTLAASVIAYTIVNAMGIDAMIARGNIDRYRETGKIDVEYLGDLSADAVPTLVRWYEADGREVPGLEVQLADKLRRLKEDAAESSWTEWNLPKQRALNLLDEALNKKDREL